MPVAAEDPLLKLLQEKGMAHERQYLQSLQAEGKTVVEIPTQGSLLDRVALTREAMASGAEVIYQGALLKGQWQGYADFLVRVPGTSKFGSYCYEPVDTKLSLTAKPKHAMQLAVYAMLLGAEQGAAPAHMHIVLGDNAVATVRVSDIDSYFEAARQRLEGFRRFVADEFNRGTLRPLCAVPLERALRSRMGEKRSLELGGQYHPQPERQARGRGRFYCRGVGDIDAGNCDSGS